jgi:SAM-dependent methyltransferase
MREAGVARLTVVEDGVRLGIVQRIDLAVHRERIRLEAERRKLGAISERDDMYKRSDDWREQRQFHDYYYRVGRRAIDHVEAVMHVVGKTKVRGILDLPCGHGRIMRFLRAAFPDADLTACDIDRDGVDFCAAEFGATPVYSLEDPEQIEIQGDFDLIYCGSLLTHLDRERWAGFLDLFERVLSPRGILVFTAEGRFVANRMEEEPPSIEGDPTTMLEEFRRTGFAYRDHRGQKGYGRTLSSPAWVCAFLERWPALELVTLHEMGIGQDVYACIKRS